MKCRNCGERWTCGDDRGPGGAASPGHILIACLVLGAICGVLVLLPWSVKIIRIGKLFTAIGVAVCLLYLPVAWIDCLTDPESRHCPKCGTRQMIYPWSL